MTDTDRLDAPLSPDAVEQIRQMLTVNVGDFVSRDDPAYKNIVLWKGAAGLLLDTLDAAVRERDELREAAGEAAKYLDTFNRYGMTPAPNACLLAERLRAALHSKDGAS